MVILRSIDCNVLFNNDVSEEQVICKTCLTLQEKNVSLLPLQNVKFRCKAPCGAEKLRATVAADRLELKDLKQRIKSLESRIQKHGDAVSEPLRERSPNHHGWSEP